MMESQGNVSSSPQGRYEGPGLSQMELTEQLKQLNWTHRKADSSTMEEEHGDKKICPMPHCRNEVRRGRYCNSCQKRKESLNRTLAQQGIHLPTQRRMRGSTSVENLSHLVNAAQTAGKMETTTTPMDVIIARKKYRSESMSSLPTFPTSDFRTLVPLEPHPNQHPINASDDPFNSKPTLSRSSSTSSISDEAGFSANYHSNSSSTMSIHSLLSPSSPDQDRSRTSSFSSNADETPMEVEALRKAHSLEEQQLLQKRLTEERILKLDRVLIELAGGEQQAGRLLKKYLTSSLGRLRLTNNPSTQ
ncbi:hypothetical protein PROFUN_12830 [Planoprotostelium fungivorum]|uniref:Uncharacterized protein n=1 Tax=Planoprotostelium fungivorum TaxID=1890364 RepID=A0A2P6N6J4_9EUKA|nr:hypothetical protein PROFUN_12830 [Planoprotostelium fungivorum]